MSARSRLAEADDEAPRAGHDTAPTGGRSGGEGEGGRRDQGRSGDDGNPIRDPVVDTLAAARARVGSWWSEQRARRADRPEPQAAPSPRRREPGAALSRPTRPAQSEWTPRTTRVVLRRVSPWGVAKVSILFYVTACLVLLLAGALLWGVAGAAGLIENVEGFMTSIGFTGFRFLPGRIVRGAALGGAILVLMGTIANVLLTLFFNLVSEVVGGIRLTFAEERSHRRR